jgi:type III secretion protein J
MSHFLRRWFIGSVGCILLVVALSGCDEQILHDLSEQDANKVLSRLSAGSVSAHKVIQSDGRWAISVPRDSIVTALAFLDTNRVLAPRSSGLGINAKSGFVPSREEQWFRYERSVAASIEESLSAMSGVLEARVHLNLPETDPLFGTKKEASGSGSVLLVVDNRYSAKDEDVSALVSGAAGVPAQRVTILRNQAPLVLNVDGPNIASRDGELAKLGETRLSSSQGDLASYRVNPQLALAGGGFGGLVILLLLGVMWRRFRGYKRFKFTLPQGLEDEG